MAQFSWIYLDNAGGRHRVGLYHGDRSGHLMIHCDMRVMQIDFAVKDTRVYSFFIEDELCEVGIYKEKEGFSYDFKVNKEVDTPRNRLRRAEEKRNRGYMAALIVGLLVVISAGFFGLEWYKHRQDLKRRASMGIFNNIDGDMARRLSLEGKEAVATLFIVEESRQRKVFYTFTTADSLRITAKMTVSDTGAIMLPTGFPLRDRDAFTVRYLPSTPQTNQLDFHRPAEETIAGYLRLAAETETRAHPEHTSDYSVCLAQLTLFEKGWRSLAEIIFQTASPEENKRHNHDSYLRLVRDPAFVELLRRRCPG
ncbi:MAG TPA: hypothetical protein PKL15_04510 [Saprospiraceae bacterium]|nr:hypothetical protein [Saprospiraceae bacterium]HNL40387.1 hypothetical protein [Saprospiraceae bacterium]HNM24665.1 hypothetical protein [Saprospiraceae bacterium]